MKRWTSDLTQVKHSQTGDSLSWCEILWMISGAGMWWVSRKRSTQEEKQRIKCQSEEKRKKNKPENAEWIKLWLQSQRVCKTYLEEWVSDGTQHVWTQRAQRWNHTERRNTSLNTQIPPSFTTTHTFTHTHRMFPASAWRGLSPALWLKHKRCKKLSET